MRSRPTDMSTATGLLTLGLVLVGCATFSTDPRIRGRVTMQTDEVIEQQIRTSIRRWDSAFEDAHLVVVSYNGVVLLAGQVATPSMKDKAAELAARVEKVRSIHNELEVGEPTSVWVRTNDAAITTKIKTRLLAGDQTYSRSVKVVTENSTVYLMGMIPREEADRTISLVSRVSGVKKIVKVFEYIDLADAVI